MSLSFNILPSGRRAARGGSLPLKGIAARWLAALLLGAAGVDSAQAAKPWQTLPSCRLVESGTNDGDSFRVQWNGGEWTVRIYFADTPESDWRFRDRTRAQAAYFGITEAQAVEIGQRAKAFTREFLKNGFEVRTRWQGVFGNAKATRKYGIVTAGGHDLAEALVANGLARIHGMGIGGQTWEEVERLRALEIQAKAAGKGAWGAAAADRTAKN